ncbi:CsgG/HfaB family protein [Persicitalea sp.]|uniref:CsgG/HfaB family protein n=1 Tax=Persicitalea sp. TaxID=3100273 RepID=UPI0035931F71
MKNFTRTWLAALLLTVLFNAVGYAQKDKEPEITIEQVAEKCKNLPRDQRVTVKVARFSVSTKSAQAHATFGEELATMLTSAIQQTNCFRVLETNRNVGDATGEMAFAQNGFTDGSGPQASQMLGAQLVVTGEITDFSEGNTSTTIMGISGGSNKATVGFTLKVLNPQTGELLFSNDINMKGKTSGFSGLSLAGIKVAGSSENRAVQDATQKAIIRAVEVLADAKDKMEIPEPMKAKERKIYNAQNCQMLRNGSPKVIILITEAIAAGTANDYNTTDLARREKELQLREREANVGLTRDIVQGLFGRKKEPATKPEEAATRQNSASAVYNPVVIEQTATQTELTRHFVESGFRVVDPKLYGQMNQLDAGTSLGEMVALGLEMGAQMIITGQAVSERTNSQGGMTACRARLEIRAISTEDGSILATTSITGGGIDVSEAIANKMAIRNATENMAQYLMDRLCTMNFQFASTQAGGGAASLGGGGSSAAASARSTQITVTNINYAQLQALATSLSKNSKVKNVRKALKGSDGTLNVDHEGTTDELLDALTKQPNTPFEVTGVDRGTVSLNMK